MSQQQAPRAAIGRPVDRVDGRLKVTGAARYAAEFPVEGVTYGSLVMSTIASGRIRDVDDKRRTTNDSDNCFLGVCCGSYQASNPSVRGFDSCHPCWAKLCPFCLNGQINHRTLTTK